MEHVATKQSPPCKLGDFPQDFMEISLFPLLNTRDMNTLGQINSGLYKSTAQSLLKRRLWNMTNLKEYLKTDPAISSGVYRVCEVQDPREIAGLEKLTELHFSVEFDMPLKPGDLPQSLKVLHLGQLYNQPLSEKTLPNLTHLQFGIGFTKRLTAGVLPESLLYLNFTGRYRHPFDTGVLPPHLVKLRIWGDGPRQAPFGQLHSLRRLSLGGVSALLGGTPPPNLTHLELFVWDDFVPPMVIPRTVIRLRLVGGFDYELAAGVLPESLQKLVLGEWFNQPLEKCVIPRGVRVLKLGNCFDKPIPLGALPPALTRLEIGDGFNCPILAHVLPPTLEYLKLGDRFNYPLHGVLPPNLTHLDLGSGYTYATSRDVWPPSIKSVHVKAPVTLLPPARTRAAEALDKMREARRQELMKKLHEQAQ